MEILIIIGGVIAAISTIVGIYLYRIPIELSLDDSKQRIKLLSHEDIITWVVKIVEKNNLKKTEGLNLNIVPTEIAKNLLSQFNITLTNSEKRKCIILLIEDMENILLHKIVIPSELSQSLKDILKDKVYVQPIKLK